MKNIDISVVVPVYGAPELLDELVNRLKKVLSNRSLTYEIILVCDRCPRDSWTIIKNLMSENKSLVGINLSKNFGQHPAISAGLAQAKGNAIVVMDCDLQDVPEEIPKLYKKHLEGFDVVFGRRVHRQDSFFKRLGSKVFFKVYDYFTGFKTDAAIANFSVISSKVVGALQNMEEQHRPYPYMVNWLGFSRCDVDIEHAARKEGKSSYTLQKLLSFAFENIVCQSNKPLILSIKLGFGMSLFSLLYALYLIVMFLIRDFVVPGWTSVMVTLFFVTGLLLANMGLLGVYIGRIFDGIKKRPVFVVDEILTNSSIERDQ